MAAKLQSSDSDELVENHEINVTPFIDVMLVLLIIFMVAAPLSTVDVAVDLPASTAQPQQRPDKPVYFTVKNDLSLALGNETVPRDGVAAALAAATGGKKDSRIFLRADKAVPYGDLMEVMNLLRTAGYLKVALVGLETLPGAAPAPSGAAPAALPAPAATAAPAAP
ncbi:TonB system transport protein ExbD [Ancylobacter sp. 6x-1]|uniref:Biopolymer transport protein ExbD n=1 Tax=Ancylobacter crimeensis TaxID=2579147 RepID=A0ABT0D8K5_9HYPH|nr:TonB system transport protein ExbD [Ancylobacter crimeensis]MCK0196254.1 TonB system transport protein ExbD [Ancylobacter crimeensis]